MRTSPLTALVEVFAVLTVLLAVLFAVTALLAVRHRRHRRVADLSPGTLAAAAVEDGYGGLVEQYPAARTYTIGDLVRDPGLSRYTRDVARRMTEMRAARRPVHRPEPPIPSP